MALERIRDAPLAELLQRGKVRDAVRRIGLKPSPVTTSAGLREFNRSIYGEEVRFTLPPTPGAFTARGMWQIPGQFGCMIPFASWPVLSRHSTTRAAHSLSARGLAGLTWSSPHISHASLQAVALLHPTLTSPSILTRGM